MSDEEPTVAVAIVPGVVLDELLNVTYKVWEWLMGGNPYTRADLAGFLGRDWEVDEFIDYIDKALDAVLAHHQPPYPWTEW